MFRRNNAGQFFLIRGSLVLFVFNWGIVDHLAAQKVPVQGPSQTATQVAPFLDNRGGDICNSSATPIPDNSFEGITSEISIGVSGTVSDLVVDLSVSHTWVGDLIVTLEHGGQTAVLMNQPGVPASTFGCSFDNISVRFEEAAAQPVENECPATDPSLNGSFQPVTPRSVFDGSNTQGT